MNDPWYKDKGYWMMGLIAVLLVVLTVLSIAPADASSMRDWRDELSNKLDAIEAAEKANMPPREIADLWIARGDQHMNMQMSGSKNNARKDYKKALQVYDDAGLPRDLQYASVLVLIGKTYIPHNDKKAIEYFGRAMPILEEHLVADHPIFISMDEFYAIAGGVNPREAIVGVSEMLDTEPTLILRPMQQFPRNVDYTGAGAIVVVKFNVELDGTVSDAEVVEIELIKGRFTKGATRSKTKRGFRRAALTAIKGYKYRPATRDGKYVRTEDVHQRLVWQMAQ